MVSRTGAHRRNEGEEYRSGSNLGRRWGDGGADCATTRRQKTLLARHPRATALPTPTCVSASVGEWNGANNKVNHPKEAWAGLDTLVG
ncbi:hypothetical protein E2562_021438 [Oryza meyeriana var. granulata]|uniref:Uncharacterized protein n=1 Tax=Oryza meyeriana var. granulata TaxID=110450 RepID=A0A6G1EXU3_9ORYZ|nr:hypothetical protein E2562_021438 [Oryza meyeriana var. granulata]